MILLELDIGFCMVCYDKRQDSSVEALRDCHHVPISRDEGERGDRRDDLQRRTSSIRTIGLLVRYSLHSA